MGDPRKTASHVGKIAVWSYRGELIPKSAEEIGIFDTSVGTTDYDLLVWNTSLQKWKPKHVSDVLSTFHVEVPSSFSGGHPTTKATQPASSGSVVKNVLLPTGTRNIYRTGDPDAFSIASADVGPITVNLEGGPLGYVVLDVYVQMSFNTTHDSANEFSFGVSGGEQNGAHPRLPHAKRLRAERFSVTCLGRILVPGGGRDVSRLNPCYYGADALTSGELLMTGVSILYKDTGVRI